MKKKTILLTGASGFFGYYIFEKIKKEYNLLTPNSKKLNLLNRKSIIKYFKEKKIDIVINAAWKINSTLSPENLRKKNYLKNVKISKNLTLISKKFSIKKFLNISSMNVYKNKNHKLKEIDLLKSSSNQSKTPEGMAKLFAINLCKKYSTKDFEYRNLIFSNIYGYNNKKNLLLIDKIYHNLYLKKKFNIYLSKSEDIKIDLLYIKDAVNAVDFFLKKLINKKFKHQFINIGSGKGYDLKKVIRLISGNKPLKIKYFTRKNKKNLITSINLADKYGWKPKFSLIKGINETTKKYRKIKQ